MGYGFPEQSSAELGFPTYLYHYTDLEGCQKILSSGIVLGSGSYGNKKAGVFGNGVYLTALPPSASTATLLENNYGKSSYCSVKKMVKKTEYVFQFCLEALYGVKPVIGQSRDIWLYPYAWIDLGQQPFIVYTRDVEDGKYEGIDNADTSGAVLGQNVSGGEGGGYTINWGRGQELDSILNGGGYCMGI